ncbi:cytokine receptor-like isoform X2 [Adelges cooleyi]|uniref:cytokine receptor-like isoform X2 n=1 Tax=Adelges cooleyi TaxID=133065 RepID=UPI00218047CD|nr:cytokine receptor-like isoform X2 [Adelges cooleyi]
MAGGGQYQSSGLHNWRLPRPPWTWALHVLLLTCSLSFQSVSSTVSCGPGIRSIGGTIPKGDIVLEYKSQTPLNITCVLDVDHPMIVGLLKNHEDEVDYRNKLSRNLVFYRNADRVAKEYVSAVDSTSARLFIPEPPAGLDTYRCALLLNDSRREDPGTTTGNDDTGGFQAYTGGANDSSVFSTVSPTSLETSGPPSHVPDSEVGVCLNKVAVGYKPLPIKNFTCISLGWINLSCHWNKPDNPVKTTYKLTFKLPGRAGGRNPMVCPTDSDANENTCFWDLTTAPIYRAPYEYYSFTISGENVLGTFNDSFRFHHYAHVIPLSPTNITVIEKTQSSAMLRWYVGSMAHFPRDLIHKIEYKSQWDSSSEYWHSVNVSDICNTTLADGQLSNCRDTGFYYYNVTDLEYPFTLYDFRIYTRSSVARGEDKWSAPGCITLKTKPTIPKRPPRVDVGSFECVPSSSNKNSRDVLIYWQHLDDKEKCGDSFEYRAYYVTMTADNQTVYHQSNETYKTYAKFSGLSNNVAYSFVVSSANKEGVSAENSTIYVSSETEKIDEPLSFTKMAFNVTPQVFELSWKHNTGQKSERLLTDYTIFWCENDKDRPYQCNGYMNWVHIPRLESSYNVTVNNNQNYQFAISANSQSPARRSFASLYHNGQSSSSGMVWASCTVLHNNIVGKMKSVWVNMIGSTFMELRWKLDCSDRIGAVLGFRIFYCPIVSINNSACKEPQLNKTVNGETAQGGRGNITMLKPYTTYMVMIALITKHGEGLHSDPLLNTTLEGAPDVEDLQINVTNVTNKSINLQWSAPKNMNGVLRYYQVNYYYENVEAFALPDSMELPYEMQQMYPQRPVTVTDRKCRLENLDSYRYYKISIMACTTVCSEHSKPIQVQTDIGVPGKVDQPTPQFINDTRVNVKWPKPIKPAGPVDFYQLYVIHQSGLNLQKNGGVSKSLAQTQESSNDLYHNCYSNECEMTIPNCKNDENNGQHTFSFMVRAVNRNPHDPHHPFYGQWSSPGSIGCVMKSLPLALRLVIWSCLLIVLSTVCVYWGNRIWSKYKIMHNVQVVLPPTLNTNFKFDHYHTDDPITDPFYVEDDHIIYDDTLASSTVIYNPTLNTSSVSCHINSTGGSTNSCNGDQNAQRWSPATATTVAVMDDDDSSSSKHQLILPSTPPELRDSCFDDDSRSNDITIISAAGRLPLHVAPVVAAQDLGDDTVKTMAANADIPMCHHGDIKYCFA